MILTEPTTEAKNAPQKVVSIVVATVVLIVLVLILALIKFVISFEREPDIVAQVVPVTTAEEPKMEKKTVMKQVKQASAASAASPIAKMIRSNTAARIVAPKVTVVTDGPLGLGEGEFGDGFGAGNGDGGMGSGATMFGSASSKGLVGRLFDMKQTRDKKGKAYDPSPEGYFRPMRRLIDRKFSEDVLNDYYEAKIKLGFTFIAIPNMDANEGPKAFQADKEIQPRGWFIQYEGTLDPPEPGGSYRFYGMFDDMLIVFINGKPVLDASWDDCLRDPSLRETSSQPSFMSNRPVFHGKWVKIDRGANVVVLIGERPGGRLGGTLMVEQQGENYKKRGNGSPILPLFTTVKVDAAAMKLINATGYQYAKDMPVFRASQKRSFF